MAIPIVAIGGITYSNMAKAFRAGADSIAVVREVSQAENVEEKVMHLRGKARAEAEKAKITSS